MHLLCSALLVPYVPVRVTRMRRFGRSSVYYNSAISLQNLAVPQDLYSCPVSLWNDLEDPVFDGVGLAGFKTMANAFLLA